MNKVNRKHGHANIIAGIIGCSERDVAHNASAQSKNLRSAGRSSIVIQIPHSVHDVN